MVVLHQQLLQEARRLAVDVLYSEKGHFMAARMWKHVGYWISVPSAMCAAVAGAAFFKGTQKIVPGVLAVAASALTALGAALGPSDRAMRHQRAGVLYAAIRRQIRNFVQVQTLLQKDDEVLYKCLQEFTVQVSKLQAESPAIFSIAYRRAKNSIDGGSADYTEAEMTAATGELPDSH